MIKKKFSKNSLKITYYSNDDVEEKETNKNNEIYIYFRNPKYRFYAKKFSTMSTDEIEETITKMKFTLKEKIHIGIMLRHLATKICQQGEYNLGDKTCYDNEKKFEEIYQRCFRFTREKLKKLCPLKSELPISAQKNVLAEMIADGIILGEIPKCPSCNGGRLRFNLIKGTYFCPGFMEGGNFESKLGDNYIFCNKTFQTGEINRIR